VTVLPVPKTWEPVPDAVRLPARSKSPGEDWLNVAASVPGLEAASLADFEVIRRIGVAPRAEDDALILALAKFGESLITGAQGELPLGKPSAENRPAVH
jgi:hypothetical protein